MQILVSGSLAYDSIMNFPDFFRNHILPDKIHNINVSFTADNLKLNFGGTAGNIAYNLALLGERPRILATAGNDFEEYGIWLRKNGIDTSSIKIIKKESTALAHIITDKADNQIAAFYPGAMKYSGGEIGNYCYRANLAIIAAGFKKDMLNYAKKYKKLGIPYIFDPGQQITMLDAKELKEAIVGARVFISNDYELSLVMGKTGWTEKKILDRVKVLVTTLGEKGSIIKTEREVYKIPPAKLKALKDPTGAGDAYRAGFIKGFIGGWKMEKIGRLASVVSAYAAENYGTQNHKFSWKEIKKRYQTNFKAKI